MAEREVTQSGTWSIKAPEGIAKVPAPVDGLPASADQNRGRKRSRSPRNIVLTKLRSSSFGRSLSRSRIRNDTKTAGTHDKELSPSSPEPRPSSASSGEEDQPRVSRSPGRWKFFSRNPLNHRYTHPRANAPYPHPADPARIKSMSPVRSRQRTRSPGSPPPQGGGVLRSMRRHLRQMASRARRSGTPSERKAPATQPSTSLAKDSAVAQWLDTYPMPQSRHMSQLATTETIENSDVPSDATTEPRAFETNPTDDDTSTVRHRSAIEEEVGGDGETDELEASPLPPEADVLMFGEGLSMLASAEDGESTATNFSRIDEAMKRTMTKGKDGSCPKAIQVWEITIHLISGSQLVIRDSSGTSDPYVKFKYKGKLLEKSKIVRRSLNPIWDELFCFYLDDNKKPIEVRVFDHDKLSDDYMGRAIIDLERMELDRHEELTLELQDETGKSKEQFMGTVRLSVKVSSLTIDAEASTPGSIAFTNKLNAEKTMSSTASCSTIMAAVARRRRVTVGANNAIYIQPPTASRTVAFIKGIRSALDTGRNKFKQSNWIATVTITLIEGKNLLAMDNNGLSDPFVKFRLGAEKYRSKVQRSTLNPRWLEQFDLRLTEECVEGGNARFLKITVWDHDDLARNDFMGRADIDLLSLERESTHLVEQPLEDGAGLLRMLITISGTYEADSVTDLRNYNVSEVDRQRILAKFSIFRTFSNVNDVGWLQVKVLKAEGLVTTSWSKNPDPFCVVELVNSRLQTHTEYKTTEPEWNKVFVFNVHDIHSYLEVTVFDEDRDRKSEFLGRVAIPLLRIRNGEKRWYALKDRKLMRRAKGAVLLEMDFIYNQIRAAWRTINPKEKKYALPNPKFKIAVMRRHIDRVGRIIDSFILFSQFVESCWSWESPMRSIFAFISYMVIVWTFEPYMLPLTLALIFLKEYVYNKLVVLIYKKTRNDDVKREDTTASMVSTTTAGSAPSCISRQGIEEEYNYATTTDDDDDKSDKQRTQEDKRTLKERIQTVQDTMVNVQESIGSVATFIERIHNTFMWSVPWLSMFAVIVLIGATVALYLVPIRWLMLAWGVNKFTKKLIRPNFIDNNELLDFLSRVPSHMQMLEYKEMKPDLSTTSDTKKR